MPFRFQARTLPDKLAPNSILHLIPGLYPDEFYIGVIGRRKGGPIAHFLRYLSTAGLTLVFLPLSQR